MASLQFESGRLTPVYHPMGTRSDGEPRYKRANYDILDWAISATGIFDRYVVPLGIERVTGLDLNDSDRPDGSDAIDVGQEFGFYGKTYFIVEPHEGNGSKDELFSIHAFGYL